MPVVSSWLRRLANRPEAHISVPARASDVGWLGCRGALPWADDLPHPQRHDEALSPIRRRHFLDRREVPLVTGAHVDSVGQRSLRLMGGMLPFTPPAFNLRKRSARPFRFSSVSGLHEALAQGKAVVVHVGDSPQSYAGGVSRAIRNHLARTFDSIRVFYLTSYDPLPRMWVTRQVPALVALWRLLRLGSMRSTRAVLHVHMSDRMSLVREGSFCFLGRLLGWRICVTRHASNSLNRKRRLSRLGVRLALAPAHVVHVLSEGHASVASVSDARLAVIPNDVEVPVEVATMAERQCAVVFAGEFGHRKGADVLLSAWAELDAGLRKGWTLEVFGRVDPSFSTTIEEHDDDSVRIHGLAHGDVVYEALLCSAVAVLPSREEALPMFLLEAMGAGCAIVATRVGAIPSVLGDGAAEIVEPGDRLALTTALASVMGSLERRVGLASAARHRILTGYDQSLITARWEALYLRILR